MPAIPCPCGNDGCPHADNAAALQQFCDHHSLTVFCDIADDTGALATPMTTRDVARIVAERAGVPEWFPYVRTKRDCEVLSSDDIREVGLYCLHVDAGEETEFGMYLWVVPSGEDPDRTVEATFYEEGNLFKQERDSKAGVSTPVWLTDAQKVMLNIVDGPVYEDACDHAKDEYQFTIQSYDADAMQPRTIDVYLYDYGDGRQGVCLRKSDLCSDYESGPVEHFIRTMHQCVMGAEYDAIIALLATHHVRLARREKASV